jgi:hypothetical protein
MQAHKALTTLLLTVLLTLGLLLPAVIVPLVHAENTQGETTLYFTDALNFLENTNVSELGFVFLTQTPPVKQNDSEYPPSLFIKNTSKFLPKYSSNADQWITWFTDTWALSFLNESLFDEYNLSDLFGDIEFLLPNPYRVIETYTYTGNDTVKINGDVSFNLYFEQPNRERINKLPTLKDSVEVKLYAMNINSFLPKLIKNTTITLETKGQPSIYKQQIILQNISYTLAPEDSLLFSIEILPSNKTFSTWIKNNLDVNKKITRWQNFANFLENRSKLPKIQSIGTIIKDIFSALDELGINITAGDIADLYNSIASSKFVYDSVSHPSSVTIPAKIIEEDIRTYFLHSNLEMSEIQPTNTSTAKSKLKTPIIWTTTQALDRDKIVKPTDITASLYFYRPISIYLGKITITATLYDDNISIATSEKELTRNQIESLLSGAKNPIVFTFTGEDREISYGHHLGLSVSMSNKTILPLLNLLKIQYDSIDYPSSLRVKLEETRNIQINNVSMTPADGKIIPAGSIQYLFNITSKKTDTLQISTIERKKTGTWVISTPTSVAVSANSWVTVPVFVNSTNNLKEAYGNSIDLIIVVTGNTGIARYPMYAEVSEDSIHYQVEILDYSPMINISKGENKTFYFIIKNNNTGAIDDVDSYTVTAMSEHDFPLIPREKITDVQRGTSTEPKTARVFIQVPKNTSATSDIITITVTSDSNSAASATIKITVNILGGGFLEELYNIFDSAAKSLGLNDMFGSDGAFVLGIILTIIIIFLLIILAFVLTTKPACIICTDRIKEIESNEKAIYNLTVQNPRKTQQTYEIYAEQTAPTNKWIMSIEPLSVSIDGQQTHTVQITAAPAEHAEPGDWTQIKVLVKKTGKKNSDRITLLAMLKEGKTLLQLGDVSHWPTKFIPGEKVTTSFTIANNGTITARNVNVFFYLNGKQKNKINVTIPAGSIADIQIPWIATKGKNKIRIRLKEQ